MWPARPARQRLVSGFCSSARRVRYPASFSAPLAVGASDHSTTKSLYAQDPDGLELEVHWVVPADLIDQALLDGRTRILPLDLPAAKERFGAHTPGGIGISQPAHA